MIEKFLEILGLRTFEKRVEDYVSLQKEMDILKAEIDNLAEIYQEQENLFKKSIESPENKNIVEIIQERQTKFRTNHINDIAALKGRYKSIDSKILDIEREYPKIKEAAKQIKEQEAFTQIRKAYDSGSVSFNMFNDIIKAKKGKVHYADVVCMNQQTGEILLLKRSKESDFEPQKFCLPGGHLNINELPEVAAERELNEETGIKLTKEQKLEKIGEYEDSKCKICYYKVYFNVIPETVLDHTEHEFSQWVKSQEIKSEELLSNLYENLKKMGIIWEEKVTEIKKAEELIEKAYQNGIISKDIFFKSVAQIGEIRKWQDGTYKKINTGKWVKIDEKKGKEKEVATSGIVKKIKNELNILSNSFIEEKKKFENSLETKYLKGTIQYRVFFERAWSEEQQKNIFLQKIQQEQKNLNDEIREIVKQSEIDKKQEREKIAGKKEIDFEDLNDQIKEFLNVFRTIEKEIPQTDLASKIAPNVTVDDYYLDTEAFFEPVLEYQYKKINADENEDWVKDPGTTQVLKVWKEMKESGKYEFTQSPKSNSQYLIDREKGDVYRMADHWGRCASCWWSVGFENSDFGIAKCNVKDFKRKDSYGWFNPQYRVKMVEGANLVLPQLKSLVQDNKDFYLTDKAKGRIKYLTEEIFDKLKYGAGLCEKEVDKLRGKYNDLFNEPLVKEIKKSEGNDFTEDQLKELIEEHEKLIPLLEKYIDKDEKVKVEYEKQKKELEGYKDKLKSYSSIKKAFENGVVSEEIFEKARSGVYKNTLQNRKLNRVGQKYGSKKIKDNNFIVFKDKESLLKYFDKYNLDLSNLSEPQLMAIGDYRDIFGVDTNKYLRTGEFSPRFTERLINKLKGIAKEIKLAFNQVKAKDNLILYRKIYNSNIDYNKELLSLNVGDSFNEKGFVSTSLDKDISLKNESPSINIIISVKKGQNILPMQNIGSDDVKERLKNEFEILLPPSTFKVINKIGNFLKLEIQ